MKIKTLYTSGIAHLCCLTLAALIALPELQNSLVSYFLTVSLLSLMGVIFLVDLFTKEIYHSHMWALLAVNLLLLAFNTYRQGFMYAVESVLGGALLFLFLFAVCKLSKFFTGRQGLGEGDYKLMGILGLWLGIRRCFFALALASVSASIVILLLTALGTNKGSKESKSYPFAPFLCLGTVCAYLFADKLIDMYTEFLLKLWS